jgi:hypothetical protein
MQHGAIRAIRSHPYDLQSMTSSPAVASTHRYAHTQRNAGVTLLFGIFGAATLASLAFPAIQALPLGPRLTIVAGALAMIGAALAFSALTIVVDDGRLTWHFGAGLLSKRVPLGEIAAAEWTTTSWFEGLGVHLTARGWLYNVGGRGAVLVTLRDGERFLLGTDEPEALVQALGGSLGRTT